jgi:hypothetical protein
MALQEEILSTRALVFSCGQMSWRCLCGQASEKSPGYCSVQTIEELADLQYNKWRDYPSGSDGFNEIRLWLQQRDPMPDRVLWRRNNQYDRWYNMVTAYTLRSLKDATDILRALSGLASTMAQTHGCTYLAGLWKEDLQIGLAWYVQEHATDCMRQATINPSNLPTWSWASHCGKYIAFRGWKSEATHVAHEGLAFVSGGDRHSPGSPDPFGKIENKRLTVSGPLRRAIVVQEKLFPDPWRSIDHNVDERSRWLGHVRDPDTGYELGQVALDSDRATAPVDGIFCLLCTVRKKYGKWHLTCLALVPTDESKEEYRRVGLVFLRQRDCFGELDEYRPPGIGKLDFRADNRFLTTVTII